MKKYRIAVEVPIVIYLEVEAEDVKEAYGKVREISPFRRAPTDLLMKLDFTRYSDDGHKFLGTNVGKGSNLKSEPSRLHPLWHTYEINRNEHGYIEPCSEGWFPQWVDAAEPYPPKNYHEVLVKVPALIRVINLYVSMKDKDPTNAGVTHLWACLRKVLSESVIETLETYHSLLDFHPFDYMPGVGDKTREKIKKFSDELEGSEEFKRLMDLRDYAKGEKQ